MNINLEISDQNIKEPNAQELSSTTKRNVILQIGIASIILITVLFSWVGSIDNASEDFIDTSLKQAAIVYGTARAINATVSILQTFALPGIGLGIGQGLDPLNSIVERFSTIMEISIGSLFIQKILIEITTATIFNVLLTISAIPLLASLFLKKNLSFQVPLKIFLSFAFLRFALVISLLLNGLVSTIFIEDKIISESNIIENASTGASNEVNEHNKAKEDIKELDNQALDADGISPIAQPQGSNSVPVVAKKGLLERFKNYVGVSQNNLSDSQVTSSAQNSNLQNLKDWTIMIKEKIEKKLSNFNPLKVAEKIKKVVENMINLMAMMLLQTLLLPIFFMYLVKWITFAIWDVKIDNLYQSIRTDRQNLTI